MVEVDLLRFGVVEGERMDEKEWWCGSRWCGGWAVAWTAGGVVRLRRFGIWGRRREVREREQRGKAEE
ncbi:uncharacterized protein G2W53_045147 [Senna tora]|uniref:Uncharacterized protein n=1 Tax=Senna tora TaxID=362788 RepID=A0A834SBJ9_9FABA|nr:uncharacterized protein G2W53_045147 [Senna tora]